MQGALETLEPDLAEAYGALSDDTTPLADDVCALLDCAMPTPDNFEGFHPEIPDRLVRSFLQLLLVREMHLLQFLVKLHAGGILEGMTTNVSTYISVAEKLESMVNFPSIFQESYPFLIPAEVDAYFQKYLLSGNTESLRDLRGNWSKLTARIADLIGAAQVFRVAIVKAYSLGEGDI